jgi:signal transduction histidine kinase
MGMGLPISQTILENHFGSIRAESAPGVGTLFLVRLPIAVQSEIDASADVQHAPQLTDVENNRLVAAVSAIDASDNRVSTPPIIAGMRR